jgi:hypothetical protein
VPLGEGGRQVESSTVCPRARLLRFSRLQLAPSIAIPNEWPQVLAAIGSGFPKRIRYIALLIVQLLSPCGIEA